jgi:hypothetical protein
MFQWIISFLSAPIFNTLLNAWKAKLESQNTAGAQAADVAKAAMIAEVQNRAEANKVAIVEYGKWYTILPRILIEFSVAIYFFKVVVWDNVVLAGEGNTPAVHGDVGTWMALVISFWFGGAAIKGAIATARTLWR